MRKWIGIATGFVAVVGFLLLKPSGKSIEELKQRYETAYSRKSWADGMRDRWNQITQRSESWESSYARRRKRIDFYESQLIKAGYLEARAFTISNNPSPITVGLNAIENSWSTNVLNLLYTNDIILDRFGSGEMIARIRESGSNQLIVVTRRGEIPELHELIRKWDVP